MGADRCACAEAAPRESEAPAASPPLCLEPLAQWAATGRQEEARSAQFLLRPLPKDASPAHRPGTHLHSVPQGLSGYFLCTHPGCCCAPFPLLPKLRLPEGSGSPKGAPCTVLPRWLLSSDPSSEVPTAPNRLQRLRPTTCPFSGPLPCVGLPSSQLDSHPDTGRRPRPPSSSTLAEPALGLNGPDPRKGVPVATGPELGLAGPRDPTVPLDSPVRGRRAIPRGVPRPYSGPRGWLARLLGLATAPPRRQSSCPRGRGRLRGRTSSSRKGAGRGAAGSRRGRERAPRSGRGRGRGRGRGGARRASSRESRAAARTRKDSPAGLGGITP